MNENNSWVPAHVPAGLSNVVALAAGGLHVLALRSDGTVVAWGDNSFGQTNVPAGLTNAVAVAAGTQHSLAVRADGTVIAWGGNSDGQASVPGDMTNVVAVAAGDQDSLALKDDGTVVGWGLHYDGSGWVAMSAPADLANTAAIAACDSYGLALIGSGPPPAHAAMKSLSYTNKFSVQIPSQSGRVYVLEYKDALTDLTWSALPLVAGDGGELSLRDPTPTGNQRFYRVRRW
jgi:alpha-tubulin suppressor-like RCC1 family protein